MVVRVYHRINFYWSLFCLVVSCHYRQLKLSLISPRTTANPVAMLAEPAGWGGNLTSGSRQNHVGVLRGSGDLGDPSTVPLKGPPHCHLLGHFGVVRWCLLQGWIWILLEVRANLAPHRIWAQRKRKQRPGCKNYEEVKWPAKDSGICFFITCLQSLLQLW